MLKQKVSRKRVSKTIVVELIDITPDLAEEYLQQRAKNRKIIAHHAAELATDMREGNWIFNGIPICFNQAGELIEGQHRLEAIAKTGITQKFVVVWGIAQEAFDTYDLHAKRSTRDYLTMEDYHYAPQLAAASRYLTIYNRYSSFYSKEPATHKEKMETIRANPELITFVNAYAADRMPIKISASMVATVHILLKAKNATAADKFMNGVVMGEDLKKGDPRYACRNWIIKRPIGDIGWLGRDFTVKAGNVLLYCWNSWREGESLTVIKPVRETPEIHG